MADQVHRSWLMRKFESAIQRGFMRAYHQVRVDPARFLMHLRSAHSLPISSYEGVFQLDLRLLDGIAVPRLVFGASRTGAWDSQGA